MNLVYLVIRVIGKFKGVHTMKNIQISEELFVLLIRFHLFNNVYIKNEIVKGLENKVEAITCRALYTKYKTAPTGEEKEKARIAYLESKGYDVNSKF